MKAATIPFAAILLLFAAACSAIPEISTGVPSPTAGVGEPGAYPLPDSESGPVASGQSTGVANLPLILSPGEGQAPPPGGEEQFAQDLARAIESRDFDRMRDMMAGSFTLAGWRSEGMEMAPDTALEQLRQAYLPPGSAPAAAFGMDLATLLGGADPLAIFGPQANAAQAFFLSGLGSSAADEAIAIISRDPSTSQLAWRGLLVAQNGFQMPAEPGEDFDRQLAQAVEGRNFDLLRSLMGDRFSILTWNTELREIDSGEAIDWLRGSWLADGATPAVRYGTDIPALLGGADPLVQWGPVANPVRAMHVMGLGSSGAQEAVLVIGSDATTGRLYWHGILVPPDGYFRADPGASDDVVPTDVQYVMAQDDLNVRSGPGLNYAVEGMVFEGQIAQVTGKSADGAWWRINCTQDASGYCWISADPELTQPTTAP